MRSQLEVIGNPADPTSSSERITTEFHNTDHRIRFNSIVAGPLLPLPSTPGSRSAEGQISCNSKPGGAQHTFPAWLFLVVPMVAITAIFFSVEVAVSGNTHLAVSVGLLLGCLVAQTLVGVLMVRMVITAPLRRLQQQLVLCQTAILQSQLLREMVFPAPLMAEMASLCETVGELMEVIRQWADQHILEMACSVSRNEFDETVQLMQAKDLFFASLSHEMRTPLTAIIGMAEILQNTTLTERQEECVDAIALSGDAMHQLVNDILDFSKLQADKLTLEAVVFNIRECVEHSAEVVELKAEAKKLELILLVKADVPSEAVGDPCRIRQVLFNLLSNSVKFTKTGFVALKCYMDRTREHVIFEVQDTGIGLSPETISKLFQPFAQADSSTTRKYGGTGLGLVICKQLVDRMGGHLSVNSDGEGQGCTFQLVIPFVHPDAGDHKDHSVTFAGTAMTPRAEEGRRCSQQSSLRKAGLDSLILRRCCIVVVDSHELRREATMELLRSMQIACKDGYAGPVHGLPLIAAAGRLSEIILAYHSDPAMKIEEVLAKVRDAETPLSSSSSGRKLVMRSIILVTNITTPAPDVLREGVVYCTKPLTGRKVVDALAKLLSPSISSTGLPSSTTALSTTETDSTPRSLISRRSSIQPAPDIQARFIPMKVLIVDDTPLNVRVLTLKLQQGGFLHIDGCSSGSEALFRIRSCGFIYDVIFMDVCMPDMDGNETTKLIKTDPKYRGTPIVGITGNCMPEEVDRCLNAGMVAVLSKPFNTVEMFDLLKALLETPAHIPPPPSIPAFQMTPSHAESITGRRRRSSSIAVVEIAGFPTRFDLPNGVNLACSSTSSFCPQETPSPGLTENALMENGNDDPVPCNCAHPCAVVGSPTTKEN